MRRLNCTSFTRRACWCFLESFSLGLFVRYLPKSTSRQTGRRGGGGDLDESTPELPREIDRVVQRDDAELFAINSDDSDFAGADFAVDPDKRSRRKICVEQRAIKTPSSVVA